MDANLVKLGCLQYKGSTECPGIVKPYRYMSHMSVSKLVSYVGYVDPWSRTRSQTYTTLTTVTTVQLVLTSRHNTVQSPLFGKLSVN